jgi:phosphodiester glycosidase
MAATVRRVQDSVWLLSLVLTAACQSAPAVVAPPDASLLDASSLPGDGAPADGPVPAEAGSDAAPADATPYDATLVDATPPDGASETSDDASLIESGPPDATPALSCPGDGGLPDVWCDRPVASGVVWRSRTYTSLFCGAQRVNVIDVDLTQPGLRVLPVQGNGGAYETVSSMGARTGALAGINGGFFCNGTDDICTMTGAQPTCDPSECDGTDVPASGPCTEPSGLSLLQIDGGSISTNCKTSRATFGTDATGRLLAISQVSAGAPAPQPNAIGAGPMLVGPPDDEAGAGTASVDDESLHWPCTMHPRTAVAIDDRGHVLFVTFDGGNGAVGVTLAQAASFLVTELNARQAMNFDGGGSTALYVNGVGLANVPSTVGASGPEERAVYDGLFVYGP